LISETWASESFASAELSLDGNYNVFRKDRACKGGGGVCILVKKGITCCEVSATNPGSEIVAVDFFVGSNMEHRIICSYFSPTGSSPILAERMQVLCSDLEILCLVQYPVVITGDFNQPSINWNSYISPSGPCSKESIFLAFCVVNSFTQLVPTRPSSGNI